VTDPVGGALEGPERLYGGYVFDLDGTVYLGEELLPGAGRLLRRLRELGRRVVFVSNNPTRDPEMYAEKLRRLGVEVSTAEILNTVVTMTRWLARNHPDATVFPIAEAPLCRALAEAGIRTSDRPEEIDLVVASYDRGFDYGKLQIAFDAIWYHRRARLVATNLDRFCPFPGGRGEPDAGAVVAAIEACTGVACEVNAGKPDPLMLEAAMELLELDAGDCVLVGDRLSTDVAMARAAGMPSALVLTGETTPELLAATPPGERPTWVLDRVDRLLPASAWAGPGPAAAD
jgi:HAD superfamily hydrolase (TIGR01450 family)